MEHGAAPLQGILPQCCNISAGAVEKLTQCCNFSSMELPESHFCRKTHALLQYFGKIGAFRGCLPKISRNAAIFRQSLSKTSSIAVQRRLFF
ncbi:MAG: hypothetical protein IJ106_00350 [Parasporobacterium sp.]|nr:hypothetical protein [Parasporobacterium sp.]